jgi:hypothetical protein
VIFIECKSGERELDEHDAQLSRYFNATPSVRVAILTNGVRLKVFTDLKQPNIMDDSAWLDVDLRNPKPAEIDALRRLRKPDFDAELVVSLAEEMAYYNVMVAFIAAQLDSPSEPFVRFVADEIPTIGRLSKKIVERLTPILRKAIQTAILGQVARGFNRQTEATVLDAATPPVAPAPVQTAAVMPAGEAREGVVTTPEELECFSMISKMIREVHPDAVVSYRDSKSYFTIIQKNVRKWFVRLGVERHPYWVAFRHVKLTEARRLCPGVEVTDGAQFGDCRFIIKDIGEVAKLRSVLLAAYEAEAARVAEEADAGDPVVPDAQARH